LTKYIKDFQQTFTSEAAAVNSLASAYKRAIAAQIGFTGPVKGGGKGPGLKKYSTGTTQVPGSGNTDSVPTMLTPVRSSYSSKISTRSSKQANDCTIGCR